MALKKRREFLVSWVTPAVVAISLPQHASATPGPVERPFNVTLTGNTCDDSNPTSVAMVTICNNEPETIEVFHASGSNYVTVVDPTLPFTVTPGECRQVTMEGGSEIQFTCNGDFGIAFQVRSTVDGDFGSIVTTIENA